MSDHVIIAHGMSELDLLRGIISSTRQEPNIHSRDGGRRAIAMSHLPGLFGERPFDSEEHLHKEWPGLKYNARRDPRFPELRIFPVMDYDGDDRNVVPYVTGNLLRGARLSVYVVPVLNYPNLERVMADIGYDVSDLDKGDYYKELVRNLRRRDQILDFYNRIRDCGDTNMDALLFHVLERHPAFQDVLEPPRRPEWSFMRVGAA